MLASQIERGEIYMAKVSGQLVPVKVELIFEKFCSLSDKSVTRYKVLNLVTHRYLEFRSAARFRRKAHPFDLSLSREYGLPDQHTKNQQRATNTANAFGFANGHWNGDTDGFAP